MIFLINLWEKKKEINDKTKEIFIKTKELRQEIEQELLPKCKAVGTTGALAVQR